MTISVAVMSHWQRIFFFLFMSMQVSEPIDDDTILAGTLRLFGGNSYREGRVEIYVNGTWGTVCSDGWNMNATTVACRQLGIPFAPESCEMLPASDYYGDCMMPPEAYYGIADGLPIWLDDISCEGNEASLLHCSHSKLGHHDCFYREDVAIACLLETNYTSLNGRLRLVNGSTKYEGRVEIFYNGLWGTVCDDSWDNTDAAVVCRQLNLTSSNPHVAQVGEGRGNVFLDEVNCNGQEMELSQCMSGGYGNHDCLHDEDAGVSCPPNEAAISTEVTPPDCQQEDGVFCTPDDATTDVTPDKALPLSGIQASDTYTKDARRKESISVWVIAFSTVLVAATIALLLVMMTIIVLRFLRKKRQRPSDAERREEQVSSKHTKSSSVNQESLSKACPD